MVHSMASICMCFPVLSDVFAVMLARLRRVRAPALKPTHKAGRRGGESIAR